MEKLNFQHDVFERLCKATNKYGLYIAFDPEDPWDEIVKATGGLIDKEDPQDLQILMDGGAFFLLDTEEECWQAYWKVIGDDGPTKLNSYSGPVIVYALTFGPDGKSITENT